MLGTAEPDTLSSEISSHFGISRGVSRYAERLVSHNLTFKILTRLRVWFYGAIEPTSNNHSPVKFGGLKGPFESIWMTCEFRLFFVRGVVIADQ